MGAYGMASMRINFNSFLKGYEELNYRYNKRNLNSSMLMYKTISTNESKFV